MEVRAVPAGPEANLPDDFRHVPHDHHVKRVDDMTRVIAAIDALPQLISGAVVVKCGRKRGGGGEC